MRRADHLWKVDNDRFTGISSDENIEFIEITMNKAGVGEPHDDVHQCRVEVAWGGYICNLPSTAT